ncbi:MAG: hypothetical protein IKD69_11760 [Solobacterium sp.]|nr:hypothetical protein [Solobacterium sp.]
MNRNRFSHFIILLLFLSLSFAFLIPANADHDPVPYIDETGNAETCADYQLLDTDHFADTADLVLEGGWYVISGNVTYNNRIEINAPYDPEIAEEYSLEPVRLILTDGCTLNLKQGIHLDSDNGLEIYSQSGGTGVLNASYDDTTDDDIPHAVIGGNAPRGRGGYLTINGGVINVTGSTAGAGIGGSVRGSLDALTINGGKVTVENTAGGAAIGVGLSYQGSNYGIVTINGGEVYADSHYHGQRTSDAIGGHYECGGLKELNINGGKVTAFGRYATVGMDPCAMMTYGTIHLGDSMKVSAGYDPDHVTPVADAADRIDAIRSNACCIVEEEGFGTSSEPADTASAFGSKSLPWITAIAFAALAAVIIITRNHTPKGA